jgi:hypothetical protein
MGGGVLVYFGWPRAHENEASRAVKAGLAVATWAAPSPQIDPAVNYFGNVISCYDEQFYAALYSHLRHSTPKSPTPNQQREKQCKPALNIRPYQVSPHFRFANRYSFPCVI